MSDPDSPPPGETASPPPPGATTPATEPEHVEVPAIGPPTRDTERRQSPAVLAPSERLMDPTGAKHRLLTVVTAAGHLLNNNVVRELRDEPGIELIGQAATIDEAEAMIIELMPRVALVGLGLGRDTAGVIALCRMLREQAPTVAVVVMAETDRPDDVFECIRNGASSCSYGKSSPMTLPRTVVGAHRRESVLSPGTARAVLTDYERIAADPEAVLAPAPELTATEEEVLTCLASGEAPAAIADRHQVTLRTIGLQAGYAVAKLHRTYHDDAVFRLLR